MQNSLQSQNNLKLNPRWLLVGLLPLVGVALFPYGLIPFGRILSFSPKLEHEIYHLIASSQAHVVGHATIFFVIGTAVLLSFSSLLQRPKLYFSIILVLGILQEFLQIIGFKHRGIVFDDIFDVFVDLTGALAAFLLLRLVWRISASVAAKKSNEVAS
jgi:glycopeptide antibiotics resistance protein